MNHFYLVHYIQKSKNNESLTPLQMWIEKKYTLKKFKNLNKLKAYSVEQTFQRGNAKVDLILNLSPIILTL